MNNHKVIIFLDMYTVMMIAQQLSKTMSINMGYTKVTLTSRKYMTFLF